MLKWNISVSIKLNAETQDDRFIPTEREKQREKNWTNGFVAVCLQNISVI